MKKCTKCGKRKRLTSFNKESCNKDGLEFRCRICSREDRRVYYQNGGKKFIDKSNKRWAKQNPEKIKEYAKKRAAKWRTKNPEKSKIYDQLYRLKNKKKLKVYIQNYNKKRKEEVKIYEKLINDIFKF